MTTIYDFTWDQERDAGVWVFDGRREVLVEALIREIDEDETDEIDRVFGRATGDYTVVTSSDVFPAGSGVLLPGAKAPVFGAAAEAAWAAIGLVGATGAVVDNGRLDVA